MKRILSRFTAILLTVIMLSSVIVSASEVLSATNYPTDMAQFSKEELIQWINGTAAILNYQRTGEYDMFELAKDSKNAEQSKSILISGWNINNPDELKISIPICTENNHNESFIDLYDYVNLFGEELAPSIIGGLLGSEAEARIPIVKSVGDKWGDKGILAWDLFRVGTLVSWGYQAGYITEDEACSLMAPAAYRIKANFSNWDDAADNYLDGYKYWANAASGKEAEEYKNRKEIYETLKAKGAFPNELFSMENAPIMKDSIAPTPELLNGSWFYDYSDIFGFHAYIKYNFDTNGTVYCYAELPNIKSYSKGRYTIENNALNIEYYYISQNGVVEEFDEPLAETDTFRFTRNGNNLLSIDSQYGDVDVYLKDEGIEFVNNPLSALPASK